MESSRFDQFTKALATSTSRRQALKTIAATTLGSLLGLSGIGTVFAKPTCKPNGHGCGTNKQCCSGYCDPTTGTCACPSQQTTCNGTCVNTQNDPNNCGGCGNVCPEGVGCSAGICFPHNYFTCVCTGGTIASCFTSPCTTSVTQATCTAFCAQQGAGGFVSGTCVIGGDGC